MNKPIRKVSIAVAVLFLALFVNLNVVQVLQGSSYRDDPQNRRVLLNEYANPRGQIVVGGTAVADSVSRPDELKYLRVYPKGPVYAPITGYYSYIYGTDGIESTNNDVLSGDSPQLFTTNLASLLTGRNPRGGSVDLTLSRAAQTAAYNGLRSSGRAGAVVALDPTSGAILAAVSAPSYDPSALSSHSARSVTHAWACYIEPDTTRHPGESTAKFNARVAAEIKAREPSGKNKGCSDVPDDPTPFYAKNPTLPGPLTNRAFTQTYPPGSLFKVIVSAAALKQGINPDTKIAAPQYYWPLQPTRKSACAANDTGPCIHNFTSPGQAPETCDGKSPTATLDFALEKSCNTAFAALAVQKIGAPKLAAEAKAFGLDTGPMSVPLTVAPSTIGNEGELANDDVALAQSAFGQRSVSVTPLQAAMIASAVANNGTLYKPYVVASTRRPNTTILTQTSKVQISQVIDPSLDSELISMMENVVSGKEAGGDATGHAAAITDLGPSVVVGGKTGTADHGDDANGKPLPAHSWFSGFALVRGAPKIAVAVILENSEPADGDVAGRQDAAPVAQKVMEAYLRSIGVKS